MRIEMASSDSRGVGVCRGLWLGAVAWDSRGAISFRFWFDTYKAQCGPRFSTPSPKGFSGSMAQWDGGQSVDLGPERFLGHLAPVHLRFPRTALCLPSAGRDVRISSSSTTRGFPSAIPSLAPYQPKVASSRLIISGVSFPFLILFNSFIRHLNFFPISE